jgi:hypothetical protein
LESFEAIGKSFAGYGTDGELTVEGKISRLKGFNENWEQRVRKNPYFKYYMNKLLKEQPDDTLQLVDSLGRDMGTLKNPNFI